MLDKPHLVLAAPPDLADGWMKDNFGLLTTLDRLFEGDREFASSR